MYTASASRQPALCCKEFLALASTAMYKQSRTTSPTLSYAHFATRQMATIHCQAVEDAHRSCARWLPQPRRHTLCHTAGCVPWAKGRRQGGWLAHCPYDRKQRCAPYSGHRTTHTPLLTTAIDLPRTGLSRCGPAAAQGWSGACFVTRYFGTTIPSLRVSTSLIHLA